MRRPIHHRRLIHPAIAAHSRSCISIVILVEWSALVVSRVSMLLASIRGLLRATGGRFVRIIAGIQSLATALVAEITFVHKFRSIRSVVIFVIV